MPDLVTHDARGAPLTLVPSAGTRIPGQLLVPSSPIGLALIATLEDEGPEADAYSAIARVFVLREAGGDRGRQPQALARGSGARRVGNLAARWFARDAASHKAPGSMR
jgi:hypothetical protein